MFLAACDGHTTLAHDGELPSQHRGVIPWLVAPHKDLNRSLQMKKKRVRSNTTVASVKVSVSGLESYGIINVNISRN